MTTLHHAAHSHVSPHHAADDLHGLFFTPTPAEAYEHLSSDATKPSLPLLLVCDHASAVVPAWVGNGSSGSADEQQGIKHKEDQDATHKAPHNTKHGASNNAAPNPHPRPDPDTNALGLSSAVMQTHIAYDLGAEAMTRWLANALNVSAVISRFSRLVVDPNRLPGDADAVPEEADGVVIPANQQLTVAERLRRVERLHEPYHHAITRAMMLHHARHGVYPSIAAIHSCTPCLETDRARGIEQGRPWVYGVLWNHQPTRALAMIDALRIANVGAIGDNQPYSAITGANWTCERHGVAFRADAMAIEVRQDLIHPVTPARIERWGSPLAAAFRTVFG
ncbi:MAG: N-formylglutamate amidohydrolase [Alphaproteobacteria bacterium]|nr:N-formylglutamate amidohydrolase [Alphaproteobacteria bacterium]